MIIGKLNHLLHLIKYISSPVQVSIKNSVSGYKHNFDPLELNSKKIHAGYANMPAFNAICNQEKLNKISKINIYEDLLN